MSQAEEKAKALAVKEGNTSVALLDKFASLGATEAPVDARDLLLSKILCMQAGSDLVKEEKAKQGEIRDSLSSALLAAKETPLEVILFNPFKTWTVFKASDKSVWLRTVPIDDTNVTWERETAEEVRYETLNYYALLTSEIAQGEYIPRLLSLRSTSYKTGKKIESRRTMIKKFGKPLPFQVFKLTTTKKNNEKHSWFIFDVAEARDSTDHELTAVKDWVDIIIKSKVTVDNSDLEKGDSEPTVEDTGAY